MFIDCMLRALEVSWLYVTLIAIIFLIIIIIIIIIIITWIKPTQGDSASIRPHNNTDDVE